MPRKTIQSTTAATTPKDVEARWDKEGIDVLLRIQRAASSLAWYKNHLKTPGLKPESRETYLAQIAIYEPLLASLRERRDAAKVVPSPSSSPKAKAPAKAKAKVRAPRSTPKLQVSGV